MYYELYIDVLFLQNLVMDFLLLHLTAKLMGIKTSWLRLMAGSALGAVGICLLMIFYIPNTLFRSLLMYIVLSSILVFVGLKARNKHTFVKGFICLYLGGFLLGGAYQWLTGWARNFFILSLGSYMLLTSGTRIFTYFQEKKERIKTVCLFYNQKKCQLKGLKDTGNSLADPITGQPVSIVSYQGIEELFLEAEREQVQKMFQFQMEAQQETKAKFHYIPYHSIGKENGLLPGITLDKLCVQGEEDELKWYEKPVIAICKTPLSSRENYQMILHPAMVEDQALFK